MSTWKSKADWKDPSWKYTPAAATDVAKTIARIKREMKEAAEREPVKVTQLKKVAK